MQPGEALAFGADARGLLGGRRSALLVNWLAAALLAFTIFFYVVVYTMWLKRSTPQNIVIGGAAGAFPPMIGWAAVDRRRQPRAGPAVPHHLLLDAAAFLGAGALRADDYARAGVPMLPVVAGDAETRRQILLYTLAPRAGRRLRPGCFGFAGTALWRGRADLRRRDAARSPGASIATARGAQAVAAAKRLFAFSILYLFLLFAVLLVEQDRLAFGCGGDAHERAMTR